VNPGTPLRDALTEAATERAAAITALGNDYPPVCDILDEKAFVNGIVGLMATGGSTNLVIHLVAMARRRASSSTAPISPSFRRPRR
jgi:phosphogluconate dehydratase